MGANGFSPGGQAALYNTTIMVQAFPMPLGGYHEMIHSDDAYAQLGSDELRRIKYAEAEYAILLFLRSLVQSSDFENQVDTLKSYLKAYKAFYTYRRDLSGSLERKEEGYGFTSSEFLGTGADGELDKAIEATLNVADGALLTSARNIAFDRLIQAYEGKNHKEGILFRENYRYYKREDYAFAHTLLTVAAAGIFIAVIGAGNALAGQFILHADAFVLYGAIAAGVGTLMMSTGLLAASIGPKKPGQRIDAATVQKPLLINEDVRKVLYGSNLKDADKDIDARMEDCLKPRYGARA